MNRTWALRQGEYAEGPRVVSTTLRPVRPAVLIPEDDPGMAARFAESRSLAWGGHACYALPFSRSEGLRGPWRRLLDLLDPDQVYALGISRPRSSQVVNMHAPREKPSKPLLDRMQEGLGRLLYTAEEGPECLFTGTSALMHSVLDAVGEDLKPPDSERFVVVPRVTRGYSSSPYLPVVARYGGVNDAAVEGHLNGVHSHRYRFDLDLSESVRVEEVGGAEDLLDVLAGDLSGLLEDGDFERAMTLPELTREGLQIKCRGTAYGVPRGPVGGRGRSRYGPIVVTGRDDSVEDFALFWTLRAEHRFARPFPLWIPIDLLEDGQAPAAVEGALGRVRPSVMEAFPRKDDVLIVSASVGTDELRERLDGLYPEARIGGVEDPVGLFTATCEYYYAKEKLPAHFDRGRASLQPPRPEELRKSLIPQVDYVAYEVGVDGLWMPQGEAMGEHLGRLDVRDDITKRGNLRFVEQFNKDLSETDLLDLRTPDGWTLLCSVFEERGYDVSPTAKSRTALGQLALLGGVENLKVAASSKVHGLLRELSLGGRGEDRAFVSERRTEPIGRFDKEWGRESGRDLLGWFIGRRLLFRGTNIKCPRCELERWYEVDRIGETWRCDGCKEDMPIPLHPQSITWRYKINELYAHGLDQGTLTPLLTLHAMHLAWGTSSIHGGLGFYPCVELKAKEGADVPFDKKEIDLVAIRGGELILAECKESARPFAEPGEAASFARQLGDLVVLAEHLGASRVLAASPTQFPEEKNVLLAEMPADRSVDVDWLDNHDLLDPNIYLRHLSHPTSTGGRVGKTEGWETDYLDWARRSVLGPSA